MSKLRLVGLTRERDAILNALASTAAAEIKDAPQIEGLEFTEPDFSAVNEKAERVECAIAAVTKVVEKRRNKADAEFLESDFSVGFSQFIGAENSGAAVMEFCGKCEEIISAISDLNSERSRLIARKRALLPFEGVEGKLSFFKDTKSVRVLFGTFPAEKEGELKALCEGEGAELKIYAAGSETITALAAVHVSLPELVSSISALGFKKCPFDEDMTAAELLANTQEAIAAAEREIAARESLLYALKGELKQAKIYADYLAFSKEKLDAAKKFPASKTTFLLEAYVPKSQENAVLCAIKGASAYVYAEFEKVGKDELPPTLMRNNRVVKNFEFVTNMYTPPHYGELDPNGIMAIFFSVFLGFIMADIGYGILMMAIGFGFALTKKRDSGMKRLMNVIGYGGIFTVIFGVLFGSFFGFAASPNEINTFSLSFLPKPIIPDAQGHNSTLAGISIPTVLLIALGMGAVQLMASNLCRAWAEFREGRILDGVFFGLIWAVFLAGMLIAVLGMITELNMGYLALPGAIIAVASLVIGAVTAGMHAKGFGKITKGFGAVYGIINYLSDILSYARLYGLMLSGAIIAQIASGQGLLLVQSGGFFSVLGVIVIIIGHAFNLAMGLLGAYIHDARLQYIEFFSRFYGGEGELFAPLGSKRKYIYLETKTA